MAFPTLTPTSQQSAIVLPPTGTASDVLPSLPFGIYTSDAFVSGAVDQVAYTYRKIGGDVLDIEIILRSKQRMSMQTMKKRYLNTLI
jgi:hypothetical protein